MQSTESQATESCCWCNSSASCNKNNGRNCRMVKWQEEWQNGRKNGRMAEIWQKNNTYILFFIYHDGAVHQVQRHGFCNLDKTLPVALLRWDGWWLHWRISFHFVNWPRNNIRKKSSYTITILNASPLTTRIIIAFLCMPIYLCCCLFTVTLQNMNFLYTPNWLLCFGAITLLAVHWFTVTLLPPKRWKKVHSSTLTKHHWYFIGCFFCRIVYSFVVSLSRLLSF